MAVFSKNEELSRQRKHIAPVEIGSKGFKRDALNFAKNYGLGVADMALSTVGGKDIIKDDAYKGRYGKAFGKATGMGGHIMQGAGQVAATAIGGPAGGKLMGSVQKTFGGAAEGDLSAEDLGDVATNVIGMKTGANTGTDTSTATKAINGGESGSMDMFAGQATGKMGTAPNMEALKRFEQESGNIQQQSIENEKEAIENEVAELSGDKAEEVVNKSESISKAIGGKGIDPVTGQYIKAGTETLGNIIGQHKENKRKTMEERSQMAELPSYGEYNYWD